MITIGQASGHTIVMSGSTSGDVTCAVIRDAVTGRPRLRGDTVTGQDGRPDDVWTREGDHAPATVIGVYDMTRYGLDEIETVHGLATIGQWVDIP